MRGKTKAKAASSLGNVESLMRLTEGTALFSYWWMTFSLLANIDETVEAVRLKAIASCFGLSPCLFFWMISYFISSEMAWRLVTDIIFS